MSFFFDKLFIIENKLGAKAPGFLYWRKTCRGSQSARAVRRDAPTLWRARECIAHAIVILTPRRGNVQTRTEPTPPGAATVTNGKKHQRRFCARIRSASVADGWLRWLTISHRIAEIKNCFGIAKTGSRFASNATIARR